MDQFERHKRLGAAEQVICLDPGQPDIRVERPATWSWQLARIDAADRSAELTPGEEANRPVQPLGVKALERLHDSGCSCRPNVQTFSLGDRDGAGIRPRYHDGWNAEGIKARHVGNSGDSGRPEQGF